MFNRFFINASHKEKAALRATLDFLLACLSRLLELMAVVLLCAGLADWLAGLFPEPAGRVLGPLLSMLPACLFLSVCLCVFPFLRGELRASCGLDARSGWARLRAAWPCLLSGFFYLWLGSWCLLLVMRLLNIYVWAAVLAALVWGLVLVVHWAGILTARTALRPMGRAEIPQGLAAVLRNWEARDGAKRPGRLLVSERATSGVGGPFYLGDDIVVPQKAVSLLPADGLKAGIVMAIVAQMLKLSRNYLILRLGALTMAVPASMMLLYSLGHVMGYPLLVRPAHVALVWLGCWLSFSACELVLNMVRRLIHHRLNLAAAAILGQARPVVLNVESMADLNLVPWKTSRWVRAVSRLPCPEEQMRALAQNIAQLSDAGKVGDSRDVARAAAGSDGDGGPAGKGPAGRGDNGSTSPGDGDGGSDSPGGDGDGGPGAKSAGSEAGPAATESPAPAPEVGEISLGFTESLVLVPDKLRNAGGSRTDPARAPGKGNGGGGGNGGGVLVPPDDKEGGGVH
ncbi:MAG: hypothetical protein LBP95_07500 [Deltaproteobacteria bacterium]|jgi:hypothetical protein|nr:hypothetical protein [Deltaproteobacteria bacterium]